MFRESLTDGVPPKLARSLEEIRLALIPSSVVLDCRAFHHTLLTSTSTWEAL